MKTDVGFIPFATRQSSLARSLSVVGKKSLIIGNTITGTHWSSRGIEAWIRKPLAKHALLRRFAREDKFLGIPRSQIRYLVFAVGIMSGLISVKVALSMMGVIESHAMAMISLYIIACLAAVGTEVRLLSSSAGPLHRPESLPGVLALRSVMAEDPMRLAVVNSIVSAVESTGANFFMDTVRRELGDEDALALALLFVCPDDPSVLRGGERDELLARVAELALSKESTALLGDNPPAILIA